MPAVTIDPSKALQFATEAAFETWLSAHHAAQREVWVLLHKAGSGRPSITGKQGIDVALYWGWIDAVRKRVDDGSHLQRYTPRSKMSIWSQVNTANVERLLLAARMQPPGLREVAAAKADGRWAKAYGGGKRMPLARRWHAASQAAPTGSSRSFSTTSVGTARRTSTKSAVVPAGTASRAPNPRDRYAV